jgi:hypothetical protein
MIKDALYYFAAPLLSLIILLIIFSPLEKCFPAKTQRIFRPAWLTDLCFFLGQYLIWGALVFGALAWAGTWLSQFMPTEFRSMVGAQPWWLQAFEVILISDFFYLLGTSYPTSRAVSLALSRGASQCGTSGLVGGASRTSAGYDLHGRFD